MPGVVHIYAIMDDGSIADDGTKKAIFEACDDEKVRPLTDLVEVLDPETVDFGIDFTYYVDRNSTKTMSSIAADVRAAVEEYIKWQTARIGRDINPSKLTWLLRDTGIKRVDIKLPVFTSLRDGSSQLTPQFARHVSTKITNEYYKNGNRKSRYQHDNTDYVKWWLRSVRSETTMGAFFCYVDSSGNMASDPAYWSFGFAPAFKV